MLCRHAPCLPICCLCRLQVSYSTHVCQAFLSSRKATRDERAREALSTVTQPVLLGALTTLTGTLPIYFCGAETFRAFFKMIVAVILIGLVFALVLLPVVLSLLGPANTTMRKAKPVSGSDSDKASAKPKPCEVVDMPRCKADAAAATAEEGAATLSIVATDITPDSMPKSPSVMEASPASAAAVEGRVLF